MRIDIPRIIIAGTHSGVGKTTVSLAVMAGLTRSGYRVQPYKVGPDYIDPGYHRAVTRRASHNLDGWLLSEATLKALFQETSQGCDIAVIEGVMGLYDGWHPTDDAGSTAQIAKLLNVPVVLVVDAQSMARSVAAVIKGYQQLDADINIAGVILNKVSSTHHATVLKKAIAFYNKIPVLGCLFKNAKLAIAERYLGLQTVSENARFRLSQQEMFARIFMKGADGSEIFLEDLFLCARSCGITVNVAKSQVFRDRHQLGRLEDRALRIAYAKDEAFQFYYQANLDFLERCGVELVSFSPLYDEDLPEDIGGLYFGGGFPEAHAQKIKDNVKMRYAIKRQVARGIPIYAECGGLIYLAEQLKDREDRLWPMTGVIPGVVEMTSCLQDFGYCQSTFLRDTFLGEAGTSFRGHEFHYSRWNHQGQNPVYIVEKRQRKKTKKEGYCRDRVIASYIHCHFLSSPQIAVNFIAEAKKWRIECL